MTTYRSIALLFLTAALASCAMWEEDDIAITDVPPAALDAARGAVDGFEIKSAEAKEKDGRTIYEIDGKANGVKHEVKVTGDGEVLKVKTES